MSRKSLIIVGAGMVGAACALRLQAAGRAVTLIDPGEDQQASSFGNAGHIAVEQVAPLAGWGSVRAAPAMLFGVGGPLDFRWSDVGHWLPWSARFLAACRSDQVRRGTQALGDLALPAVRAWRDLLDLASASDLMVEDGHALLWFDPRSAATGRSKWLAADIGSATCRGLTSDELSSYQVLLAGRPPVDGLRIEGTARLTSPQRVREALVSAFVARGGDRRRGLVTRISPEAEVELADGTRLSADQVLVASGVRSGAVLAPLGTRVPLIAERGYSIQFPVSSGSVGFPTAVLEDWSIVLAPQIEGLRATSYVEFGDAEAPPDPRKWSRLISRVRALGFDVPDTCQRWMGCRPTLPDYVPAIGAWPGQRLLYAFGHQHLGVTLAAITAERIEALANGGPTDPALDIRRF
ncbi:MAG: FAD-dependent oxidoreductase [Caulobacterales bacterium]|nr:FAD-dependent oxidoreductase [Caulobacterales bacterium]